MFDEFIESKRGKERKNLIWKKPIIHLLFCFLVFFFLQMVVFELVFKFHGS